MTRTPWLPEALQALAAVFRLARFDRRGADAFADDLDQCARSFRACVLAYPFYMAVLMGDFWGASPTSGALFTAILAQSIGFVIECLIFPVAAISLLRWYHLETRWVRLVSAYNWWGLAQTMVVAAGLLLHKLSGGAPFAVDVLILIYLFCLLVEGFVFEIILDVGVVTAGTLVVVDVLLGHFTAMIANAIS